jgi:hypothetical protein
MLQRNISSATKMKEGELHFDELVAHLKNWNAQCPSHPTGRSDPITDRFVRFCFPIKDGFSVVNAFVLETLEQNRRSVQVGNYCYVCTPPVTYVHQYADAPSFVLFVLGTDLKYTHKEITRRWKFIGKKTPKP